jgi:putative ABC transport system permease protein
MIDFWQEILETLRRNKLRTFLTALSVSWGIFMLVILLGTGTGLEHGVKNQFKDDAINSIWIFPGQTSIPYEGHPVGRQLTFRNDDYRELGTVAGVDKTAGRFYIGNDGRIAYGDKASSFDVRATHPEHQFLEKTIMVTGRFLNDLDLAERRKVAVIGRPVSEFFFGDEPPLGKWLRVNGIAFQVIGTFRDEGGEGENDKLYIPISTAQAAFGGTDRINQMMFTVGDASASESKVIAESVRTALAAEHHFDPTDPKAIRFRNNLENFEKFTSMFGAIRIFVLGIGIGTILAGIVAVSNIMLIAVKERTKEIGIRKALGATPFAIVSTIVLESVFITSLAGYVGLVGGIFLLDFLGHLTRGNDMFADPTVDLGTVLLANAVLIVAGALAGFFPARSAAKVNPVIALRDG